MSSWDFTEQNAFGTQGAIAFPGVDGYSRNLWDTDYDNWGPRIGAAYQLNRGRSLRGGFGITYLPSNTGYFSGPTDYGSAELLGRRDADRVRHEPARRAGDPLLRSGADRAGDRRRSRRAPQVYGIGEARFDRHFKNGQARQWNIFLERSLVQRLDGLGRLHGVGEPQPASTARSRSRTCRAFRPRRSRSGASSTSTATARSTRRPSWCRTRSSRRAVRCCRSRARSARRRSRARTRCSRSRICRLERRGQSAPERRPTITPCCCGSSRRFAGGLMIDANYTWSKNIDNTDTVEDNQGFNAGAHRTTITCSTRQATAGWATATCRIDSSARSSTSCRSAATARRRQEGAERDRGRLADRRIGDLADRLPDRHVGRQHRRGTGAAGSRRRASTSCCRRVSGAGTTAGRR